MSKKTYSKFSIEPADEFQKKHLREADDVRREIYKNMSAEDKLKEAGKLWYMAKKLKKSYYRDKHPDWGEEKIEQEVRSWLLYART